MITLDRRQLQEIRDAAEAAYPAECCGLLVGSGGLSDGLRITRVVPSPNLAAEEGNDRFEIDTELLVGLHRELKGGPERVVGLYHSHPDHPAAPSERDLEGAWDPKLIWLITAVEDGRAARTTAHVLEGEGRSFEEIALRVVD